MALWESSGGSCPRHNEGTPWSGCVITRVPRRLLVNAHLWALGLEDHIKAENPVDFVGPYDLATFGFGGFRRGVKPADLAGCGLLME